MQKIGMYLMIFGAGSIVLSFLNMNFRLLMWIDLWGETVGAVLFFMGKSKPATE